MARTDIENQNHWKGKIKTGACFLDGVYSPIQANELLKTDPLTCKDLRDHAVCERYFGYESCPDPTLSQIDVAKDEILSVPSRNFSIPHWKLVECGSNLPPCAKQGDWVPKGPIQSLCRSISSGVGKTCAFGSLPNESHMSCMSSPTGIAQCRDWFDKLVKN
jgi:hypothetical protein